MGEAVEGNHEFTLGSPAVSAHLRHLPAIIALTPHNNSLEAVLLLLTSCR